MTDGPRFPKPVRKPKRPRKALPRRRGTKRRQSRVEDPAYLAWIRTFACCAPGDPKATGCGLWFGVVPHHATRGRGLGQKTSDDTAVPLCSVCHDGIHKGLASFKGWAQAQRREWHDTTAARFRAAYKAHHDEWSALQAETL